MIEISPEQLKIVNDILANFAPECEVRVFGSRVNGNAKPYSDLDLALIGRQKLSLRELGLLSEAFQECELPFRVDIIDWDTISDSFRKIIEHKYEVIRKPGSIKI